MIKPACYTEPENFPGIRKQLTFGIMEGKNLTGK